MGPDGDLGDLTLRQPGGERCAGRLAEPHPSQPELRARGVLRLLEQQKSQPSTQSQPAQSEMVRTARAGAESPDAGLTRRRPGESPGADRPEEKELKI